MVPDSLNWGLELGVEERPRGPRMERSARCPHQLHSYPGGGPVFSFKHLKSHFTALP